MRSWKKLSQSSFGACGEELAVEVDVDDEMVLAFRRAANWQWKDIDFCAVAMGNEMLVEICFEGTRLVCDCRASGTKDEYGQLAPLAKAVWS